MNELGKINQILPKFDKYVNTMLEKGKKNTIKMFDIVPLPV